MKRRTFVTGATAGAAALAMPHIAPGAEKNTVHFVPHADLAMVDPVFTTALVTRNHGFLVFDQLYGLDENLQPQPQMVAGETIEDDGKTWRITLREGLRFHDGEPVRAKDAIASIDRWTRTDAFGQDLRAATDEMSAASDSVFVIRLKKPFPLLSTALAKPSAFCPVMPERFAANPPTKQITEVVGSGPFRFLAGERVSGARAVYEKFDGYVPRPSGTPSFAAGPKVVYIDRVQWHTIPDGSTAAAALQQGEVDWWENPTPDVLPLLRRASNLAVEVKDKAGYMGMIRFNHLQPPFDNPAIRRAFLPGVSQTEYMTAVMGDDRSMWNDQCGFFLPTSPYATADGLDTMKGAPDIARVKKNLEAAGYKGEKVVFVVPTDIPSLNAMSEIAADMFRRVGVNLDYQASDWGSVAPRLNNKEGLDKNGWSVWCNFIPGIIAVTPATQSYVRGLGKAGPFGWPKSERIEELRGQFLDATDDARRKAITRALQLEAFENVPYIPTGAYQAPSAFSRKLSGIPSGFPQFYNVKKGA